MDTLDEIKDDILSWQSLQWGREEWKDVETGENCKLEWPKKTQVVEEGGGPCKKRARAYNRRGLLTGNTSLSLQTDTKTGGTESKLTVESFGFFFFKKQKKVKGDYEGSQADRETRILDSVCLWRPCANGAGYFVLAAFLLFLQGSVCLCHGLPPLPPSLCLPGKKLKRYIFTEQCTYLNLALNNPQMFFVKVMLLRKI